MQISSFDARNRTRIEDDSILRFAACILFIKLHQRRLWNRRHWQHSTAPTVVLQSHRPRLSSFRPGTCQVSDPARFASRLTGHRRLSAASCRRRAHAIGSSGHVNICPTSRLTDSGTKLTTVRRFIGGRGRQQSRHRRRRADTESWRLAPIWRHERLSADDA